MQRTNRVLVTGGGGFIGLETVTALAEAGYRVRVVDSLIRADVARLERLADSHRVELVTGDIRESSVVSAAARDCHSVVHLAAESINSSVADPAMCIEVNLGGLNAVACAAVENGIEHIVFASSASVYGNPRELPMREDHVLDPITPYCISKRAGEDLLSFFGRQHGIGWTALRFFNVYGPGQKRSAYYTSVIDGFVQRLRDGGCPTIHGRGDQSMDFVHVSDVAQAIVAAIVSGPFNGPINVGTGVETTIRELARKLISIMSVDVEPVFEQRPVIVTRRRACVERAHRILGWSATTGLDDGLVGLVAGSVI